MIESYTKIKAKLKFINKARVGDHIWWISNNSKFKKDYPKWKQNYDVKKIIKELIIIMTEQLIFESQIKVF